MRNFWIFLGFLTLGIVVFLPNNPFGNRTSKVSLGIHLKELFSVNLENWKYQDLELGSTERATEKAVQILNFDDYFYREYRNGDLIFSLYVAYWGEGKMPAQLVASHTPDRCWVENGMQCLDYRFNENLSAENFSLRPAQWRIFTKPDSQEKSYVLYWHLIDGELYDFGERLNAIPHPFNWIRDALKDAFLGTREQYFVRLVCNVPFKYIWEDNDIRKVVSTLKNIGLAEPETKIQSN